MSVFCELQFHLNHDQPDYGYDCLRQICKLTFHGSYDIMKTHTAEVCVFIRNPLAELNRRDHFGGVIALALNYTGLSGGQTASMPEEQVFSA